MFGFLFGKKREKIILPTSLVYASKQVKWNKIIHLLEHDSKASILYFDESEKTELERAMANVEIDGKKVSHAQFYNLNFPERIRFVGQHSNIIFIDHSTSFVAEQKALKHLQDNCSITQFNFYISLEDRILKENLDENFVQLMRNIGVKEDEAIVHKSINQAITRIQQKKDQDQTIIH